MNGAKLTLFATSALLASMLLVTYPAQADEVIVQPIAIEVSGDATQIVEVVFEQQNPQDVTLDFTEAESDAAATRYGCDCVSCINAVRQLQGQLPLLQL